jgi:acyl carrier protein
MRRKEFLLSMDKLVELPRGTLKGDEKLNDLEQWNSLAIISFIALVDTNNRVKVSLGQIMSSVTVSDLLAVAQVEP